METRGRVRNVELLCNYCARESLCFACRPATIRQLGNKFVEKNQSEKEKWSKEIAPLCVY